MATQADVLKYCTVVYQAVATTDDGPDSDELPDPIEVSGWIIFECSVKKGGIKFVDVDDPFELFPQKRKVKVVNGKIDHNGTGRVKLEAASPWGNPSDWVWKVTYDLMTPVGKLAVDPFYIDPVPDATIDLTMVAPVGNNPGTQIIRGPRGTSIISVELRNGDTLNFYGDDPDNTLISAVQIPALLFTAQAEAARDAAVAAKTAAETAKGQAETARTGAQTARTGAETARDAAVTAKGQAETAKTAAEGARDTAQTWRDQAVTNAGAAQTAKGQADTARDAAQAAATTATTKAGEASTSAGNAATSATTATTKAGDAETARAAAVAAKVAAEAARDQALQGNVNDGAVTAPKLATDAVITAKIQNGAVTLAKLAADSVDSSKIVNGSIVAGDIAANAAILETQLATAVQTKLGLANNAPQMHTGITKITHWQGTQAAYDALPSGVKTAAGFTADIY